MKSILPSLAMLWLSLFFHAASQGSGTIFPKNARHAIQDAVLKLTSTLDFLKGVQANDCKPTIQATDLTLSVK